MCQSNREHEQACRRRGRCGFDHTCNGRARTDGSIERHHEPAPSLLAPVWCAISKHMPDLDEVVMVVMSIPIAIALLFR